MSKTIILSEDTEINGTLYLKNQVVVVPDDWATNIKSVIVTREEMDRREKDEQAKLEKLKEKQKKDREPKEPKDPKGKQP
jgi:hypothetical protein